MVDPNLTAAMVEYVVMAVLALHRDLPFYRTEQAAGRWTPRPLRPRRSGVSASWGSAYSARPPGGLGPVRLPGPRLERVAQGPRRDHDLHGCRRTRRFPVRHRHPGLPAASHPGDPRPPEPRPVRRLPAGAALVNTGRGGHLVEADLLAALDSAESRAPSSTCSRPSRRPRSSPARPSPGAGDAARRQHDAAGRRRPAGDPGRTRASARRADRARRRPLPGILIGS